MREYGADPPGDRPATGTLTDAVFSWAEHEPDRVLIRRPEGGPQPTWVDIGAEQVRAQVVAVAKGLLAAGVQAGDRVAIFAPTSPEWTVADYAIWCAGAVSVPIYDTASVEQARWILGDSGASAVFAGGPDLVSKVGQAQPELDRSQRVWSFADDGLSRLIALGAQIGDAEIQARRDATSPDSLATVIYTSGTTGRPKGCMLTHGNLMAEVHSAVGELPELFDDAASTVVFLPLAHVFARVIQIGCVHTGTALGHWSDFATISDAVSSFGPTFLLAVPRFFESLYTSASQQAAADGRGRLFDRATEVAARYSRGLDQGSPGLGLRGQHRAFDRVVYRALRERLGGRCHYLISGGAPLGERLAHFFRGAGLTVLEGYGLTETSAAVTVNVPSASRIGSVGRPLPGVQARVADDGELLIRGPQVFLGYWGDAEASEQALDPDGWLHTGDVGDIDADGFVRLSGRKLEILVTAGGKTVDPTALERQVRANPLISQCLVVGDGRPFLAALVTIDAVALAAWLGRRGAAPTGAVAVSAYVDDPDLRAEVDAAIALANRTVSPAEAIRRFVIVPGQWTEEGGELTQSLKLRRQVVLRQCRDDIAGLYAT